MIEGYSIEFASGCLDFAQNSMKMDSYGLKVVDCYNSVVEKHQTLEFEDSSN